MKIEIKNPYCGNDVVNSFAMRNINTSHSGEVCTLDDAKKNLERVSGETDRVHAKLAEIIEKIKRTTAENVGNAADAIATLKASIKNDKLRREALIREELDEEDPQRKQAINGQLDKLHNTEADNKMRLDILNEKLTAAHTLPDKLMKQLDAATADAKDADCRLLEARQAYRTSLDNQVNALLTEANRVSNELSGSYDYKTRQMLESAGLVEKKPEPVHTPPSEPRQYQTQINPITGKEVNPSSHQEAKQLDKYYAEHPQPRKYF